MSNNHNPSSCPLTKKPNAVIGHVSSDNLYKNYITEGYHLVFLVV